MKTAKLSWLLHIGIIIKKLPRGIRFILVGIGAATVHYLCVLLLVESISLPVLIANIIAFLIAFCFSFIGHAYLTFTQKQNIRLLIKYSLPRFFSISVSAFLCNELLFFFLMQYGTWPYQISLALVLVIVAGGTYLASQYWAFQNKI